MITLVLHTDVEIRIMLCHGFSDKNILSVLSNHLRQVFDDLYWASIMGRENYVSSTVDEIPAILWTTLQSHEVMSEFYKHEIKIHPSITSIFVRFFSTANISEPLQGISQMKK